MTRIAELKKRWMKGRKFRKGYQEANAELAVIEALIKARTEANLSQAALAKLLTTTPSSIARLEGGSVSPSLATLRRYAEATGKHLHVELRTE